MINNLKKILAVTFLALGGYADVASANALPSTTLGLAGSGIARSDVYRISCFNDGSGAPAKLSIRIRDDAPVKMPQISIKAKKGHVYSAVVVDAVDGDSNFSPTIFLAANVPGTFTLYVKKSAYTGTLAENKGAESYTGEVNCQTSGGAHTGTKIDLIINQ